MHNPLPLRTHVPALPIYTVQTALLTLVFIPTISRSSTYVSLTHNLCFQNVLLPLTAHLTPLEPASPLLFCPLYAPALVWLSFSSLECFWQTIYQHPFFKTTSQLNILWLLTLLFTCDSGSQVPCVFIMCVCFYVVFTVPFKFQISQLKITLY